MSKLKGKSDGDGLTVGLDEGRGVINAVGLGDGFRVVTCGSGAGASVEDGDLLIPGTFPTSPYEARTYLEQPGK